MQYQFFPYSWHHCAYNSTSSYVLQVTCLRVSITVPTTALALMQYRLLALQLASLYLKQCYGSVEDQGYKDYTLTNILVNIIKKRTNNCNTNTFWNKAKVTKQSIKATFALNFLSLSFAYYHFPWLRSKTIVCLQNIVIVIIFFSFSP